MGPTAASGLILAGPSVLTAIQLREGSGASALPSFLQASATAAAAAMAPALPAQGAGTTVWVTGFTVTGGGATAGSIIAVTLTGVLGGTLTYELAIPAGAGAGVSPLQVSFPWPGLPAAAANAAITLNVPSFGAGNTNAAATIQGYSVSATIEDFPGVNVPTAIGDLLDGTSSLGEEVLPFALPLGGALNIGTGADGLALRRGLFLQLASGTVRGAVWAKYLDRA